MGEPDIDLYADDLDAEFNEEASEYNHESNVDLYDDVITPSDERNDGPSTTGESPRQHSAGTKRMPVCVGNLTWWTTDKDLIEAISNIGVSDVVDIKFHENRANGQSKGYCILNVTSENSIRIISEKLPRKEIHGQTPIVTPCSRYHLNYFELQSRKGSGRYENPPDRRLFREKEWDNHESLRAAIQDRQRVRNNPMPQFPQMHQAPSGPQIQHPPPQPQPVPYQPNHSWIPPPHQIHSVPPPTARPGPVPAANTSVPPPPPGLQAPPPPLRSGLPPANVRVPPPRGPLPPIAPRGVPVPDTRAPPPGHTEWERQPPPHNVGSLPLQPQLGLPNRSAPPVSGPSQILPPTSAPPPGHPVPAPHINPAFLQHHQTAVASASQSSQPNEVYGRPQYSEYRSSGERSTESVASSSAGDSDFDEIMARNRSVSSSAISRAVADASAGEYASAIETLVTAISLIKQSRVANDERCKILISALQDTLHGIESKSYGSRSKERARSRERDRSRERSSRREKSSRRDRSRSRDRDYRDRSRERDRYHEDRYRDKERDHDRERRSRH